MTKERIKSIAENTTVTLSIVGGLMGCAVGVTWFLASLIFELKSDIHDGLYLIRSDLRVIEYRINALEMERIPGTRPIGNIANRDEPEARP